MTKTLCLFLFLFAGYLLYSQHLSAPAGFGEGLVYVDEYAFPPDDTGFETYQLPDTTKYTFFRLRYYIKGYHIYSNDRPSYLIYWQVG